MEEQKTTLRLRELMQQQQITLADLATRADMHTANLSLLVNGKRNPTLDTLDRLAQALGCPTWHLIQDPAPLQAQIDAERIRADELQQRCDHLSEQVLRLTEAQTDTQPRQAADTATAPATAPQRPADSEMPDLLTTDPRTGETHRYRLIS